MYPQNTKYQDQVQNNTSATAVAPDTALVNLDEHIQRIHNDLRDIGTRINGALSRALGEFPPEGKKEVPRPVRCGIVGVLADRIDGIREELVTLDALASRLETLA